jgi:hypothetical protein
MVPGLKPWAESFSPFIGAIKHPKDCSTYRHSGLTLNDGRYPQQNALPQDFLSKQSFLQKLTVRSFD